MFLSVSLVIINLLTKSKLKGPRKIVDLMPTVKILFSGQEVKRKIRIKQYIRVEAHMYNVQSFFTWEKRTQRQYFTK